MKYYDAKSKTLKDEKIANALRQAAIDYENGDIVDVRDVLADIISAIDQFDADY